MERQVQRLQSAIRAHTAAASIRWRALSSTDTARLRRCAVGEKANVSEAVAEAPALKAAASALMFPPPPLAVEALATSAEAEEAVALESAAILAPAVEADGVVGSRGRHWQRH